MDHLTYIIVILSNLLIFYIVYNFINNEKDLHQLIQCLLILNIMVVVYCAMQLAMGFEQYSFFGIDEFTIQKNREDFRLAGPFNAVGVTAEYFVIQSIIVCFLLVHQSRKLKRIFLIAILLVNFGFMAATGNRGGVVSLIVGGTLFAYVYRRKLGASRAVTRGGLILIGFFCMASLTIKYTKFNVLYERLAGTRIEHGMLDTRDVVWRVAWEEIKEKPILGHGPRLRLIDEHLRKIPGRHIPGHLILIYPHNLYLYIWNTIGIVGLFAYFLFFTNVFLRLVRKLHQEHDSDFAHGFIKLGMIILAVFMIDQMKVSFLRFTLNDYQHYIFMLLGMIIGTADKLSYKYVS